MRQLTELLCVYRSVFVCQLSDGKFNRLYKQWLWKIRLFFQRIALWLITMRFARSIQTQNTIHSSEKKKTKRIEIEKRELLQFRYNLARW